MNQKKSKGVYYTPIELAKFSVQYLYENYKFKKKINVLEPSCGNGVFISALVDQKNMLEDHKICLSLVEIDSKELNDLYEKKYEENFEEVNYFSQDFLDYQKECSNKFDLIIGNPPYINKKLMTENQIKSSELLLKQNNIKSSIQNIWISFLLASLDLLSSTGTILFILPAELMQVKHSENIRKILIEKFIYIELFTFNEIVFKGIEQDTVILIASKSNFKKSKQFNYHTFDSLQDVDSGVFSTNTIEKMENLKNKWSMHFLNEDELAFLYTLKAKMLIVNDICEAGAGIVTAANTDFILSNKQISEYSLELYGESIIQKSSCIKNLINFTNNDYKNLEASNMPTKLLVFPEGKVNKQATKYLKILLKKRINKRFKLSQRKKWYIVPSVWSSEGFFFKRAHLYPKLIKNEAEVLVTDSAYRIKMKSGYNIESFVFCFYNTITFIFAELNGRFYGGGVLEVTPNEFKSLPIPYINVDYSLLENLDNMFRNNIEIKEILNFTNQYILLNYFDVKNGDIELLNSIHEKLINRRLKKSLPEPVTMEFNK